MLTPKERLKTEEHHLDVNSVQVTKVAKASAINHFEQVMNAPLLKAKTKEPMSKPRFFETVNSEKKQRPSRESEETSNDAELIKPERSPLNGKTELNNRLSKMPSAKKNICSTDDETDSKQSTLTQLATPTSPQPKSAEQLNTEAHTPVNVTQRLASSQDSVQLVKVEKQATLMVTRETLPLSLNEVSSAQSMTRQSKPINNEPSLDPTNKMHKGDKSKEELPIPHQISVQPNNTPGQIILANLKTAEPMNHQLHNLVSQLVDKVQLLVPSLGSQNRIQLVLEQGQLKGTEITITLQNNQLNVTLVHSSQHADLLQQVRPELLERLQRINTDQQVRVTTTSHEQAAQNGHQEQGQQHESSQKSRVIDLWLEEQKNA